MEAARQFHLFQRLAKPRPALEFETCCSLADTIDRAISPGWKYTHLPFGEHRGHTVNRKGQRYSPTGARLKRLGTKKGWPDYVFVGPGKSFWLEMKRGRLGKVSDEQVGIAEHLLACGFDYLRASSYGEAIAALVKRGIIRHVEVQ